MDRWEVARALDEIARYVELSEPNRFKSQAFERAARSIRSQPRDPADLIATGDLTKTPGIGKATAAIIEELVRSGTSSYLQDLRRKYPPGIFDLLRVPGLGLKKIGLLHERLGIGSLDDLERLAREGRLASVRGFSRRTEEKVLEGIEKARRRESQFLLPAGLEAGELIREHLAAIAEIEDAEISGSVRRRLEVIRNVNIVVATRAPARVAKQLERVVERLERVDEETVKGVALGEMDVYFHLVPPASFGTALLRTTGSREFVESFFERAGLTDAQRRARTERELFDRAALPFVEPERRENGEDLGRKRPRRLVERADLRGTFHVHTTWSDGRNSVEEMLSAAAERGLEYVGISDHSKAAHYAGGLTEAQLPQQKREIDAARPGVAPLRVFRGTEADILPDGSIDYGARTLAQFDFVVASVHSRFSMAKDEMTERILRALDDAHVTFLGHLTGRLLLSRDGYTMDFDRVFARAGERGVMIELNGNPHRLDLDWRHVKRALSFGVRFSIHPDAHSIREYGALVSGTWLARKAGLSPKEIFNTRPADDVAEYLALRKQKAKNRKLK